MGSDTKDILYQNMSTILSTITDKNESNKNESDQTETTETESAEDESEQME